jgi:NAD(P)-dependent dehydrogenase (short-subunit alcohol dehydrogenase family)
MHDKVALITGASGGLGSATAPILARAGMRLALTGRNVQALEDLAATLELADDRVLIHAADLMDREQARNLVQAVMDAWGSIDCLLNLAGGWRGGVALTDVTDEQWNDMLHRNLTTAIHITQAILPHMLAAQSGRIVHIASMAVQDFRARQVAYNVAKSGLVALARSTAVEYGAQGIRSNVLLPGTIDTPRNRRNRPNENRSNWVSPEALGEIMLMLCGPVGDEINGIMMPVSGGR